MEFLRNHAPDIAAMDLFVVPTIGFDLLYAFIIIRLDRRDLVWISVTANPTAEWIAHQITEAFPWSEVPHYLIRDRDRIYGAIVTRRLHAMAPVSVAYAKGTPENVLVDVVTIPFNDIEGVVSLIRERGKELACVLVDPMPNRAGRQGLSGGAAAGNARGRRAFGAR